MISILIAVGLVLGVLARTLRNGPADLSSLPMPGVLALVPLKLPEGGVGRRRTSS